MAYSPNMILGSETYDRLEGQISDTESLSYDLNDEEIARAIGRRIETSEKFWESEMNLKTVRKTNANYWVNKTINEQELYTFQVPYKDNRIFISIEQLIPMTLARPPQPVITEAFNTDASRELAKNLGDVLLGKYEDLYLKTKFGLVARHLLMGMRVGIMKYRWESEYGYMKPDGTMSGDICVDVVQPDKVVFDEGTVDQENMPLIGEHLTSSVEELAIKFPEKKDAIMRALGISRGVATQLSRKVGYWEVWFTHYKGGKKQEAVAWKMNDLVLKGMQNPHFDYDNPQNNYFDAPQKPYIIFNHLNSGRYIIDDTSLSEQAQPLQDVLNKRGRQIVENADSANSGLVFDAEKISQENVALLIGDPNEKAMVKGDVRAAAMRLPTNLLPNYVLDDKRDARQEIDNIFGTHDPVRGEGSGNRTLGQDVISQRADMSRAQTLASSLEDGADRLYKGMVQMMKIFYDEEQTIRYVSPEGVTRFIKFSQNAIENGMSVRVKSGSVLPDDPASKVKETIDTIQFLDPLSIAEGLGKPNPRDFAKRMMLSKMDPLTYMQQYLGFDPINNADPQAMADIQALAKGQPVDLPASPSQTYIAQFQSFIESDMFRALPPERQQVIMQFAKALVDKSKAALGQQPQAPQVAENPSPQAPVENPVSQGEPDQKPGIMSQIKQLFAGRG